MNDTNSASKVFRRMVRCDFEAIFAGGECTRFALRLHDRWNYKIRGMRYPNERNWTHVWALKDADLGIDIRGIYPETLIAKLANGGKEALAEDVDAESIRVFLRGKEYSAELAVALDELADKIIDTHERFECVKPADEKKITALLEDLQHSANQASEPNRDA